MQPENVQTLRHAIKEMHGCDSRYVESVPVHEVFQGQTAWRGTVEVFDLVGHNKAKRVYAWQYEDDDRQIKTVAVLKIPPVDSPQSAVKISIAAKAKQQN